MKLIVRNVLGIPLLIANCLLPLASSVLPLALCLFLLTLSSCKKDSFCNCLKSTGSNATEKRELGVFNKIKVDKNVDVVLVQDSVCYVKVICGRNLLDGVKTEVKDNKLEITNVNHCNWARSYKNKFEVEVHCTDLMEIIFETSGNLTTLTQFKVDSLYFESYYGSGSALLNLDAATFVCALHTGVADMTLKGKIGGCYLYAGGQGFIDTRELENGYAFMQTLATNDCKVRVTGQLDVVIKGIGNIYYYGNPPIVNLFTHTGTGKLIKGD